MALKKWEHFTVMASSFGVGALNEIGRKGWELVQVIPQSSETCPFEGCDSINMEWKADQPPKPLYQYMQAIFKREISNAKAG